MRIRVHHPTVEVLVLCQAAFLVEGCWLTFFLNRFQHCFQGCLACLHIEPRAFIMAIIRTTLLAHSLISNNQCMYVSIPDAVCWKPLQCSTAPSASSASCGLWVSPAHSWCLRPSSACLTGETRSIFTPPIWQR